MFVSLQGLDVEPNVAIITPIRIGNAFHVHIPASPYIPMGAGSRVDLLVDVDTLDMKLVKHSQSSVTLSNLGSYLSAIFPYTPALDSIVNRPFRLSTAGGALCMTLHADRDTPTPERNEGSTAIPAGSMVSTRKRASSKPSGVLSRHAKLKNTPIAVRPSYKAGQVLESRILPWIMTQAKFKDGDYVRATLINNGKSCQVTPCKASDEGATKLDLSGAKVLYIPVLDNGHTMNLSGSLSLIGTATSRVSEKKVRFDLPYPEAARTDAGFHIEKVVQRSDRRKVRKKAKTS